MTVSSFDSLSRSDVPAVYSYDRAADEYVVYEPTERHIYETKSAFKQEWVPIRKPFVPDTVTSQLNDALEPHVIAVIEVIVAQYRSIVMGNYDLSMFLSKRRIH